MNILSADVQYLAKSLIDLTDEVLMLNDKLVDILTDHHDVLTVYDNIKNYTSATVKLLNDYD